MSVRNSPHPLRDSRLAASVAWALLLVVLLGVSGLVSAEPAGAAALTGAMVTSAVAPAGEDAPIQALGQIGGFNGGVAAQDDNVFLAEGPHLLVVDVHDPARPTIVGESALLPADAAEVLLAGRYAFVVYGNQVVRGTPGVAVVDVANATRPTVVGTFLAPGMGMIIDLAAQGTTLYVGFQAFSSPLRGSIRVVSFADAAAPKEIGVYDTGEFSPGALAIAGSLLAYAPPYDVHLLDVTDPAQPREVGSYAPPRPPADTERTVTGLVFAGSNLYETEAKRQYASAHGGQTIPDSGAVRVLAVGDPARPTLAGTYPEADAAGGLALVGSRAYVAVGGQIQALDLANPAAPRLLGAFKAGNYLTALAATARGVYLSLLDGLQVVDFTTPAQPRQAGALATASGGERLALGGSLAYDVTADSLRRIDIADPRRPTQVGALPLRQFAMSVAAVGRTAYVLDAAGLHIVDASDPRHPVEVGRAAGDPVWTAVAVVPPYAYLVSRSALTVLDITNPAAPVAVSRLPLAGDFIAIAGQRAYVSEPIDVRDAEDRIDIVDLTDPGHPSLAGSFTVTGAVDGLAASGDDVYVAVDSVAPGLAIYAAPPDQPPRRLAVADAGVETTGVALDVRYAYVSGGGGLTAVDVADPEQPRLLGRLATGYSDAVAAADGIAYVSAGSRGFWTAQVGAVAPALSGPSGVCRFILGFAALHNALPAIVGACLDNEQHNPANGDAAQRTTRGLLVWRKADNITAFTDGYHTWVAGPYGIQERLNSQRFPWEANPNGLPVAS